MKISDYSYKYQNITKINQSLEMAYAYGKNCRSFTVIYDKLQNYFQNIILKQKLILNTFSYFFDVLLEKLYKE